MWLALVDADDAREKPANFRNGQRDERTLFFRAGDFAARARSAANVACASRDKVMWRCQPTHERTSYSSKPVSCLACSKPSSIAQRQPAMATSLSSGVARGA